MPAIVAALKSMLPAAFRARGPSAAIKSVGYSYPYTFGPTSDFIPPLDGPGNPAAAVDYARLAGDPRSNTVVVICNAWYATNFPTARPQVGRIEADSGEFRPLGSEGGPRRKKAARDHPAVRWLAGRPNPFFTWRQVWASTLEDYNVDGNAFWLKAGGDPYEAYWLPRCRVNVVPSQSDDDEVPVLRYEYTNPRGKVERYRPDQVVHFRDGIDPHNPHLGISRLRRLARSIAAINAGEVYSSARARNGHSGILITPKDGAAPIYGDTMEEARLARLAGRLNGGLSGDEAGRAQWGNMPVDVHKFGDSAGDAGVDLLMNRPETNIAAAMGLNTMVLGLPSAAGTRSYANYAEADRQAWYNGVIPRQDAFAEAVADAILRPEFGDDLVMAWDRSFVPALNEDADAKAKRAIDLRQPDAFGKPLASLNEARDLAELPPVEGGDLTPIEEAEEAGAAQGEGGGAAPDFDPDFDTAPESEPEPEPESESEGDGDTPGTPPVRRAAKTIEGEGDDDSPLDALKSARGRRKGKGGNARKVRPECSAAASLLAKGRQTAESQATLGRCRAARASEERSIVHRELGQDQTARATDRFAREMSTRKERVARVKGVLAKVREGNAARPKGPGMPKAPKQAPKPPESAIDRHRRLIAEAKARQGGPIPHDAPIAERIARYEAGEAKRVALIEMVEDRRSRIVAIGMERVAAARKLDRGQRLEDEGFVLASKGKQAESRKRLAESKRLKDEAKAELADAGQRLRAAATAERDDFLAIMGVERPARIEVYGHSGTGLDPLDATTKARVEESRDFLRRITAESNDGHPIPIAVGLIPVGKEQRAAHFGGRDSHVQLKRDGESHAVIVHEFGHAIEYHVVGRGGQTAQSLAMQYLGHRTAGKPEVRLADRFPDNGFRPGEVARDGGFTPAFGDDVRGLYAGKSYASSGTELVSLGVEQLYHDPVRLAKNDPEYFKFIAGILDGDLR